jgi:hypothetical protein
MISPAMMTVETTLNLVKPVAFEVTERSPAAYSRGVGPAKARSMSPVAGVVGSTGRSTEVKNGGVLATNRGWLKK